MLSNILFWLVFCLYRFNQICFGIEVKQLKQTISKQTKKAEKIGKTLHFLKKYQNMLPIKLFWLIFCLFRFNQNI
jgi:hypothetical protein